MGEEDTMKFKTADIRELVSGGGPAHLDEIQDRVVGKTRWAVIHEYIFKDSDANKFYRVEFSSGTGDEGETPFQFAPEETECVEVVPVEKIVIEYVKKAGV